MKNEIGILINRLTVGFTFAFLYQMVVAIATSLLSLPLTGNIQDLFSGLAKIESDQGFWFVAWWIISTIIITIIALIIVKYKKYLSPYKGETDIDVPTKITSVTAIVIGGVISFLFFLTDLIIGIFVPTGSTTDVQAIYQAAIGGDFVPLLVSIIFSITAGFIVLGVARKTAKVEKLTPNVDIIHLHKLAKYVTKKSENVTTSSDTVGLHPGALVHVGQKKVEKVTFQVISYDKENFIEKEFNTSDECFNIADSKVKWINVSGIHDSKVIESFGKNFGLHPLVQSDIMNAELRPKFENHEEYLFLILKMPNFDENKGRIVIEQVSLIVGKDHVLSFQEMKGDVFDPIRERIRKSLGTIRANKSDYLAYALADAIVDNYFVVMEKFGQMTEKLEEELMAKPTPKTLNTIQALKREMILLRKSIWPLREVIDSMERVTSPLIEESTKKYLRDVYNHTIQVMDTVEALREMVAGMLDTYLSSVSNKMNEVMKTLTVIASIFIPITFLAGIYGTNFSYIPELEWEGSYFAMIGTMIITAVVMLMWFKKKGWV